MKKAGDLLGAFFDENQLKKARGYSKFFSAWREIAGERLAAHTRIAELEGSVVFIEADHPGWIQMVQLRREYIIQGIRKHFPELEITGLAIRLKKDGESSPTPRVSIKRSEEKTEEQKTEDPAKEEDFLTIKDETLRESLRRLEIAVRKGKPSD